VESIGGVRKESGRRGPRRVLASRGEGDRGLNGRWKGGGRGKMELKAARKKEETLPAFVASGTATENFSPRWRGKSEKDAHNEKSRESSVGEGGGGLVQYPVRYKGREQREQLKVEKKQFSFSDFLGEGEEKARSFLGRRKSTCVRSEKHGRKKKQS